MNAIDALDGRIDILINNAALCPPTNTVGLTDADLESTLAVNIRAPHVLVAALAPPMAEHGTGAVITIGSTNPTGFGPLLRRSLLAFAAGICRGTGWRGFHTVMGGRLVLGSVTDQLLLASSAGFTRERGGAGGEVGE